MASHQLDKQHINIIDFLRGIAALMVVFFHYFGTSGNKSLISEVTGYAQGQHGVMIFFVISGFIIPFSLSSSSYSLLKAPKFIWRRILRLNPPYYVVLLITVLFLSIIRYINQQDFDTQPPINISNIFLHLTYLVPFTKYQWYNNIFWTLAIEFQFYILIALIYPYIEKNKVLTIIFMTILCFSHYITKLSSVPNGITILNYSTVFIIGILLFIFKNQLINRKEFITLSVIYFFLCKEQISEQKMIFVFIGFIFILFIDFRTKATDFLGKISYSLYLIHSIVFQVIYSIFKRLIDFSIPWTLEIFTFFIILPIAILLSYLFYLWIELPSIRMTKKLTS